MRSRGSIFPLFLCFAMAFSSPPFTTRFKRELYSFSKLVLYLLFFYSSECIPRVYGEVARGSIHTTL